MLLRCLHQVALLLSLSFAASAQFAPFKFIPDQYELEIVPLNNKEDFGQFVNAVEDEEDFIWLAGSKSLSVFDGKHLTSYSGQSAAHLLPTGLNRGSFIIICKDRDGLLYLRDWKSTSIACFAPQERKLKYVIRIPDERNEVLLSLSASSVNDLLVLTSDSSNTQFRIYQVLPLTQRRLLYSGTRNQPTEHNLSYAAGNHWFTDRRRITRIAPGDTRIKHYELPDSNVSSVRVYADGDRAFFLTFPSKDIYTWDARTDRMVLYLQPPDSLKDHYFHFAVRGNLVYLGARLSFFVINTADNTIQDYSSDISQRVTAASPTGVYPYMISILPTREGAFCILPKQLCLLKKKQPPQSFFLEKTKDKSGNSVDPSFRGLTEDDQGNIYASFYNGLVWKPRGTRDFVPLPAAAPLLPHIIASYGLRYWKGHLLWNNIMLNLHTGAYTFMDGYPLARHTALYLQQDTLWFYIWESPGINRYNLPSKTLIPYHRPKMPDEISDIAIDTTGNIWLATKGHGIVQTDRQGKLLKQYNPDKLGIKDASEVYCLFLCSEGLWFGCAEGLGFLQPGTGKAIVYSNPRITDNGNLENRVIYSLLPDSAGNLYLGSNAGLVYFDRKQRVFYNLPPDHPLENVEFNRASVLQASDKRYYFGSTHALYSFLPEDLNFHQSGEPIRPLKICHVSIFNNQTKQYRYLATFPDSGTLHLGPFDSHLELELSVPEFTRDVFYSYRIAGESGRWSKYTPQNTISFYNLHPGQYVLEIKASTSFNDRYARYYRLRFEVAQVWYRKGWVITLGFLAALALGWLMIRNRFNNKLKRQKDLETLRTKISIDLHDDVGSTLSGLAMQSEILSYTADSGQKDSLKEISALSRDAMEQMRDIVWSMDSRKDRYENLIDRMRAFAAKRLEINKITHEFNILNEHPDSYINPEKRQTVYLIFKEAITNIVHHSNATHVVIDFVHQKKQMKLVVHDNGRRPPDYASDGMGLSNMKMRAEKIGGRLTARYTDGFTVELLLH